MSIIYAPFLGMLDQSLIQYHHLRKKQLIHRSQTIFAIFVLNNIERRNYLRPIPLVTIKICISLGQLQLGRVLNKAMQKDFISVFSCFVSFVLRFIPYIFRTYGISRHNRFAIISQNMTKLTKHMNDLVLRPCF